MKKIFIVIAILSLLTACGSSSFISSNYEELNTIEDGFGNAGTIYVAEDKSVSTVANEISENRQPEYISTTDDEKMFLLYPEDSTEEVIHLMQSEDNPEDTIIEVVEEDFAEESYDFGMLETFGVLLIASRLYGWNHTDADLKLKKKKKGYKGYINQFTSSDGTIRKGSSVRGGGPGTGK
ncbi:DUF4247 domain-containing protein [Bacillus carboniphilus]|uniref:DUF4247 domain-containing protein n=1 Tax=Bacillus carboniphilus TaxID=86663 RepID=A0ABY9JSF3_9BACI|nr:DUF4247 domain-containing protein [Bacillus carboniphilus]WLR42326.1 DUF4247 domain-containing protein [Bacillus carboniphilus]